MMISLMSFTASAATVTTLTCEMKNFPGQKFSFSMENLGKTSAKALFHDADDEYSGHFVTKSKNKVFA